jgi:hypothetical protein
MLLSDLKLEIRISKLETISKSKYQMFKTLLLSLPHFEFWSFEFVSDFGFRASNLLSPRGTISTDWDRLALSLLVLGPFADNPDDPLAFDNLAFAAYFFY